ncbi:focadhesin [Plakobranchus ocellatus]|uniref:Focadhesin n=1 Tax=Plakobranchus ocellatus TaxID=259542 RepID=A0AAV4CQV5_9GAST|nr:focadhesin [Plakobranchus ocellatus]
MISVLSHRPESWHYLTQEIAATFRHRDPRLRGLALEMIRPVVAFLMTEPQSSDTYSSARHGITRVLLSQLRLEKNANPAHGKTGTLEIDVVTLLLKLIPQSQVKSCSQVLFTSELLEDLCRIIRRNHAAETSSQFEQSCSSSPQSLHQQGSVWSSLAGRAFTMGLELILVCSTVDVGFRSLAEELQLLANDCSDSAMCYCDINLILLGELLDCPLVHEFPEIISLVLSALSACPSSANILCVASLLKPILQLLAKPSEITKASGHAEIKAKTGEIMVLIEQNISSATSHQGQGSPVPDTYISLYGQKSELARDLCLSLTGGNIDKGHDPSQDHKKHTSSCSVLPTNMEGTSAGYHQDVESNLVSWAKRVKTFLEQKGPNKVGERLSYSPRLARLAAGILLVMPCEAVTREATGLLLQIARLEPTKALDFVPVVLFALGKGPSPESRLMLLETLPNLATHKFCVSPILKIILALGQSTSTHALSVRLMTSLWRQQDRCFPQLLKMLTDHAPEGRASESNDVLLAKAGAIWDICNLKPEKHGAELLSPLSHILEVSSDVKGTAASVLLVDSLYLLCQAEVMDLLSLWDVLGPRLGRETERRPLVASRVCRLLSLVPELAVDTEEYQTFSAKAVCMLWQYVQDSSAYVRRSAFEALASFSPEHFRVTDLPTEVTKDLRHQLELAKDEGKYHSGSDAAQGKDQDNGTDATMDQLYPNVPASCYTALLNTGICADTETLKGFQVFLRAMIDKESSNLPRGLFFSSNSRKEAFKTHSQLGASLESIPTLLHQQLDRCKKPGLRPSLAVGLLFCYDPPVETGKDGRQFVVRHSNMFLQMFAKLLQEVQVQPSEWHLCSQLPGAWCAFVHRLFTAVLGGRRAQLDHQGKQGSLSATDVSQELSLAWLWTRDSILDTIRVASRMQFHHGSVIMLFSAPYQQLALVTAS